MQKIENKIETKEIAKYTPEERQKYLDSLKHYLDLKNSVDTARNEGKQEREIEIAINEFSIKRVIRENSIL